MHKRSGKLREDGKICLWAGSIVLNDNLVLIDFDDAGTVVGKHLMVDLIDHGFILEAGEIIYFFDLQGIYKITGFIDETDLDVVWKMTPKCCVGLVNHGCMDFKLFYNFG